MKARGRHLRLLQKCGPVDRRALRPESEYRCSKYSDSRVCFSNGTLGPERAGACSDPLARRFEGTSGNAVMRRIAGFDPVGERLGITLEERDDAEGRLTGVVRGIARLEVGRSRPPRAGFREIRAPECRS